MSEIIIETSNKNGNDLPGDKRTKLCQKIGGQIFLLTEETIKQDVLKTPVKFRSYRALNINKAAMHTGNGGVKGLMINDDMFLHAKNVRFTGEAAQQQSNNNNGGGDQQKVYFIALDEKTARKEAIEFNVLRREEVRGMIQSLSKQEEIINQIIDADRAGNSVD